MRIAKRRLHVRMFVDVLCISAVFLCAAAASGATSDGFALTQNEPNPFCAGDSGQWTLIQYDVPSPAFIRIVVGDPEGIIVVRTLVYGEVAAGHHLLFWDGLDDWDDYLAGDTYPYSLQLKDPDTGRWSILARLYLTIDCSTHSKSETWGKIKALYLVPEG